jgi:small subunit ribosomal protein S16
MVRIRMSRLGRKHRPFFRINAVEKRTQRDGKILEALGWYDPMAKGETKAIELNAERIKHWLAKGAQPSDTVNDLLAKHGLIDAEAWKKVRRDRSAKKIKDQAAANAAADAAAKAEPASA